MSVLYVVATPLGNLEDLSPRARRVLMEADLILAEDTRVTRRLLNAFQIETKLESHHLHNERGSAPRLIARMQRERLRVALVSDAGTPAISDPGAHLVRLAHEAGIQVFAIPGPSALTAALSVSGCEQTAFTFHGFAPRKQGELLAFLRALPPGLSVLYEAPHRVLALLRALAEVYPDCPLTICRELTKLHEQTLTGSVAQLRARFEAQEGPPRGEFVLLLQVGEQPAPLALEEAALGLEARLVDLMAQGLTLREAQARLVDGGQRKNAVYAAALRLKELVGQQL